MKFGTMKMSIDSEIIFEFGTAQRNADEFPRFVHVVSLFGVGGKDQAMPIFVFQTVNRRVVHGLN